MVLRGRVVGSRISESRVCILIISHIPRLPVLGLLNPTSLGVHHLHLLADVLEGTGSLSLEGAKVVPTRSHLIPDVSQTIS